MANFVQRARAAIAEVVKGPLSSQERLRQERGLAFLAAQSRLQRSWATDFSARARGARRSDPTYGPLQMGRDIAFLRDEALRLAHNNPHANRAISILTNWTIMSGVNIIPKARTKTLQKRVTEVMSAHYFGHDCQCDSSEHSDYWAFEKQVVSYFFRYGEILVRARPRDFADGLAVPVSFEAIDPCQLFDGAQPSGVKAGNSYAAGIEFGPNGNPVAYWLYRSNPKDYLADRTPVRVPVRDRSGQVQIVHIFEKIYPGQIRGLPRAAWVVENTIKQEDLRISLLDRKREEAKRALAIKENHGAVDTPSLPGLVGEGVEDGDAAAEGYTPRWDDVEFLDWLHESLLTNNSILSLPPGWDVEQLKVESVSDYKEFMADLHRTSAAGWGVPYSMLTTDLTQVSFSGGKLGLLDFKNERLQDQRRFINKLHSFCWSNFCVAGARAGLWSEKWIDVQFRYDAFPSGESDKDAKVIESRVKTGTISPQKACAEWGEDFYEIVDEIAEADAYLRSKGLGHMTSAEVVARVTSKGASKSAPSANSDDDEATDAASEESSSA